MNNKCFHCYFCYFEYSELILEFNVGDYNINIVLEGNVMGNIPGLGFGSSLKVKVSPSHVGLFATPWTVACQRPLSMGFSRQERWGKQPIPSPGDLPNPGIEFRSPALQVDSLPSEPPWKPWQTSKLVN